MIRLTSPHSVAHPSPGLYFLLCFYRDHIFYGEPTIGQEFSLEVPEILLLTLIVGHRIVSYMLEAHAKKLNVAQQYFKIAVEKL